MSTQTVLSRRDFLRVGGVVALAATAAACAPSPAAEPAAQSEGPAASADEALQRLTDGNKRYRHRVGMPFVAVTLPFFN